jgi:hypothetical protein
MTGDRFALVRRFAGGREVVVGAYTSRKSANLAYAVWRQYRGVDVRLARCPPPRPEQRPMDEAAA